MLRAALASQQHWRAECHGSTVALPPPCLPQTLPTDGSDSLLPAAGMGAWPHLDGPAVRRGSGSPPTPRRPRLRAAAASSLGKWISTRTGNLLTSLSRRLPSTFTHAALRLYSKYSGSPASCRGRMGRGRGGGGNTPPPKKTQIT